MAPTLPAHAADWQAPTPDELKMTADPAAPGAAAVYLYREEITDDTTHMHSLYVRIKVLTEKGKSYGDVEVSGYDGRTFSISDVGGRTIHPDGTIIPLTEKPIKKLILRQGGNKYMATVFSMPSVEPGSILEYRYKLRYDDTVAVPPHWIIQQPIYMHKGHYHFVPSKHDNLVDSKSEEMVIGMMYAGRLPPGAAVKQTQGTIYDVDVQDVPPLPDESYMPPMQSTSYRLLFYYATSRSIDEYWKREGKSWSKEVNRFAEPSKAMHAAVESLTKPEDKPDAKLHKLYAAVMELENTSFTREHTAAENKADKLKVKTADDVWAQKRGTSEELNRLFLALVRAAGFKAFDILVVNRDRDLLMTDYMDWNQLDDELTIVQVDGKDMFFDPGQRYAEYGKLHWKHTLSNGVRQTDGGTAFASTPAITYKDTTVTRIADVTLDEHDQVSGTAAITMSGAAALHWRQRALEVDDESLKRDFEHSIRDEFPPGVEAHMDHFVGLKDPDHMLLARFNLEGTLGTSAGRRVLFPASFFIASTGSLFPQQTRQTPVDLRYPILRQDTVTVKLAPEFKVESLPEEGKISLPQLAAYSSKCIAKDGTYRYGRSFALGVALFTPQEYPALREFYGKMGVKDDEQAMLTLVPAEIGKKTQ